MERYFKEFLNGRTNFLTDFRVTLLNNYRELSFVGIDRTNEFIMNEAKTSGYHSDAIKVLMTESEAEKYPDLQSLLDVYRPDEIPEYFVVLFHLKGNTKMYKLFWSLINGFSDKHKRLIKATYEVLKDMVDNDLSFCQVENYRKQLFLLTGTDDLYLEWEKYLATKVKEAIEKAKLMII